VQQCHTCFRSDTQAHLRTCETTAKQRLNEATLFGVNKAFETMAAYWTDTADLWPQLAENAAPDRCMSHSGHAMMGRMSGIKRLNSGANRRVTGGPTGLFGATDAQSEALSTYEQNFGPNIVPADARVLGDHA
jgi:hypothetical protein